MTGEEHEGGTAVGKEAQMKIVDVKAYPTSFRVPKERQVSLGIGTMTKRDCVMVKVTTEDGIVGWGESHHARSPGSIGHLINTTLRGFVLGMDASDTVGIWAKIYKFQLGSHGMGAATAMAMSGIDQALWDIKGKAVGWPLYKLLGGTNRPVPAYAGAFGLSKGCRGLQSPVQFLCDPTNARPAPQPVAPVAPGGGSRARC